jgi:hypothetical protein
MQALALIAPPREEAFATDASTTSTVAASKPGKVNAYERVVEGESYRHATKPAIAKLVDRTGSD